jgi:anti-sigma factor RsiW
MTEKIHDQMSAFLDDELSTEECAFLVRRLEHDPDARARLVRYATIGAAVRGELLQPDPGILRRRISDALDGTVPQQRRPVAAPGWRARAFKPAVGFGIAASAALIGIFALRGLNGIDADIGTLQAAEGQDSAAGYVVPREFNDQRNVVVPTIRLTNYLMHHGEYASHLSRTTVHSNVVGARDNPQQSLAAEETDAVSADGRD